MEAYLFKFHRSHMVIFTYHHLGGSRLPDIGKMEDELKKNMNIERRKSEMVGK